jgi:hypothetical protein
MAAALESTSDAAFAFGRREIRFEGLEAEGHPLGRKAYTGALASFLVSGCGVCDGPGVVGDALRSGRSLTVNVIGEPSFVLLRRQAALTAGGFFEQLAQLPDWDLWLRLLRKGRAVFVDEATGVFRVHAGGRSAALDPLALARENVTLLARVRRAYADALEPIELRYLCGELWRFRARLLKAALRSVASRRRSVRR